MSSSQPESEEVAIEERRARELYDAIKGLDERRVRDLIAAGYNVNAVVNKYDTCLGAAIESQNDAIAMLLTDAGARLESVSLLLLALRSTTLSKTAVALLKVAASEELLKDLPNFTAIHSAAEGNNTEAVQLLLKMGQPVNQVSKRDTTALITAVELGHREVTKTLLEHGARWDITKRDGLNVLDVALAKNDVQMVELILGHLYSVYETTGTANFDFDLDAIIRKMNLKEALRLLNDGKSLVQREAKRLQLRRQGSIEPVIGIGNEYLKTLCSLISDLEVSVNETPAGKKQSYVCSVCASLVIRFGETEPSPPIGYRLDYLQKSSTDDKCPLCYLILESVSSKTNQKLVSPLQVSLAGHHIRIVAEASHYRYTQAANMIELPRIFLGRSGRDRNDQHTGSDESFLQASSWLLTYLTQHPNCINAEGPLPVLPSRVIDVGPANGSQDPLLVVSQGRRGRYIALSHRWGTSKITKTTKANLNKRIKRIKFTSLTRTMQDAVTVTRKFGIRYLWIDALCIIQDSHSDWSIESCDMANIYRNALLTISAAAAFDHSEGCFRPRSIVSRELRLPQSMGIFLGVREPLRVIAEFDRSGVVELESPLDSRGWILQEQLLSPRILKYSWNQLHWECISSTESEQMSSMTIPPADIVRFKRALGGFRSTSMALKKQAHASWQQIVQSYTRRTLTKDADKLMAIMGIAKFTGDIMTDRFFAGLWERQLWRDLLWSSDTDVSFNHRPSSRLQSIQLPSWSWASVSCPVSYKFPAGSTPAFFECILKVLSVDVDSEMSNGEVHGSLVVEGRMQKLIWSTKDVTRLFYEEASPEPVDLGHKSDDEQDDAPDSKEKSSFLKRFTRRRKLGSASKETFGRGHSFYNSSLSDPKNPPNGGASKILDIGWSSHSLVLFDSNKSANGGASETWRPDVSRQGLNEVWLLAVALDRYWVHCLALVQTNKENEYRRIGLSHVDMVRLTGGPWHPGDTLSEDAQNLAGHCLRCPPRTITLI